MVVEETSVVVVINEEAERINVVEVRPFLIIPLHELVHVVSTTEDVANGVVHRIVEESGDVILIGTDVGWISVEALSHLEDSGGRSILSPERSFNFGNSVDTDSVKVVLLDDVMYPVFEGLANPRVVLIKVGQVSQAAVLDVTWVIPVGDLAVAVIVVSRVKRIDLAVVSTDGTNMVRDDIEHHPDVPGVSSIDEVGKILLATEVGVDGVPVLGPVAVISLANVVDDGRNPDGIESHALDVVKIVLNTLEGSATVHAEVGAGVSIGRVLGESISEDLVNRTLFPFGCVACLCSKN